MTIRTSMRTRGWSGLACTTLCTLLLANGARAGAAPPAPRKHAAQQSEPAPAADPAPPPVPGSLDAAVAEQLDAARQEVEHARARSRAEQAEAYGSLARILHAYEFFEAAEAAYLNAIRLAPGETRWRHLLGYLYQQTGRLDEAADQFSTVLRLRPEHREAAARLAEVSLQLNRLADAREQFERILPVFPAVAHHGLGQVALRQARYEEALMHFRAVLERAPQAAAVHYAMAMAYRGLGRLDEARSHLARQGTGTVFAADPETDALQTLVRGERALMMQGRRLYQAGQHRQAADAFAAAAAAAPGSVAARVNHGLALTQLGRSEEAVAQFEAALRLAPDDHTAHAALGTLLAQLNRLDEALPHLRSAFEAAPDNASIRTSLLRALLQRGRDDEAIGVLLKARSVDADDEGLVIDLSLLLADRLRFDEALAVLDDAHRRFPGRTATATTLARLLASSPDRALRDGPRALEIATAVHAASPSPVHAESVALALAELGRCSEAADWMRRAIAEAERLADAPEAARLRAELPTYLGQSCRR